MSRWALAAAAVAVAVAFSSAALASEPLKVTAAVDRDARLGTSSPMTAHLAIDSRRLPSPVTTLRVLYPKGLGLATSGLGRASCARPASEFLAVLITFHGLGGCSPNAVLGYGTARAEVRLLEGQVIPEFATLTLLAGPIEDGTIGLVALVNGERPFGARLAYRGELGPPTRRYGGAFIVHMPAIPSIADLATVALVDLKLDIGTPAITYYRNVRHRTGAYHPAGLTLPTHCPRAGLRFRVELAFQDGGHTAVEARARCPRA